jgi:ATP-dependent DNA helicase RecG
VVVVCEIAENQSNPEHTVDDVDSKGKKTIYLHLKKFFRGTRFTFKPFLKSIEGKHKEGEIVCVSGKVSFLRFSVVELLSLFFDVVLSSISVV